MEKECIKESKDLCLDAMNNCGMLVESCDRYYNFQHDDTGMCLALMKGIIDAGGTIERIEYSKWENKEFLIYYKVKLK